MKLDKQKILSEAPEGATHYDKASELYYQENLSDDFIDLEELLAMPDRLFKAATRFDTYRDYFDSFIDHEMHRYQEWQWNTARRTLKLDIVKPEPKRSKYHREIKPGVWVDVYDVIVAWSVTNPALQHLIKKALQPGQRGHKDLLTDMQDIIDSAVKAKQIEVERVR
jgi:hypothetical protein